MCPWRAAAWQDAEVEKQERTLQAFPPPAQRVIFEEWTGREAEHSAQSRGELQLSGSSGLGRGPAGSRCRSSHPALPAPESPFQARPSHSPWAPALASPSPPLLGAEQLPTALPLAALTKPLRSICGTETKRCAEAVGAGQGGLGMCVLPSSLSPAQLV